ncbi:MAG: glycerophosphodiester phosphodiesterase family protein [Oscillospiraceae bacterium]|nr:glycerophosphodiester phosphodiesterase family protein [Oscillospiraceae bacterium]
MFGKECYRENNLLLNRALEEKKTLIAVHRGVWGGNIVENTVPAIQLALRLGGDMAECDLSISTDGVVYLFHDTHEQRLLGMNKNIMTLSSAEIDSLTYRNSLNCSSGIHPVRLTQMLSELNHGELINIDRAWRGDLKKTLDVMRAYPHMQKQALFKTPVKDEYLKIMNECPEKYMYMAIAYSMDDVRKALSYPDINMVGVELIARSNEAELFQQEAIDQIHAQGLFTWVNTLVLSVQANHILYGDITDDRAVLESPEANWGVLMDRGIDIIQTDWPVFLKEFRDRRAAVQG